MTLLSSLVSCAKRCGYSCNVAPLCDKILGCETDKQIIGIVRSAMEELFRFETIEIHPAQSGLYMLTPEHSKPILNIWHSNTLQYNGASMKNTSETTVIIPEVAAIPLALPLGGPASEEEPFSVPEII